MNIRCLVLDDEPLAQKILLNYIRRIDYLTCMGTCGNVPDASEFLHSHQIDLLFLDINLPQIDGISFLKKMVHKPHVILTTAHRNYAFDGFEHGVVDFLLKPFSFERFLVSLSKLQEKILAGQNGKSAEGTHQTNEFIFLKSGVNRTKIFLHQIDYIEGLKDYVKVVTASQEVAIKSSMGNILQELGSEKFIRVHKSFIVPIDRINNLKGKVIRLANKEIPVGRQFWKDVKRITS